MPARRPTSLTGSLNGNQLYRKVTLPPQQDRTAGTRPLISPHRPAPSIGPRHPWTPRPMNRPTEANLPSPQRAIRLPGTSRQQRLMRSIGTSPHGSRGRKMRRLIRQRHSHRAVRLTHGVQKSEFRSKLTWWSHSETAASAKSPTTTSALKRCSTSLISGRRAPTCCHRPRRIRSLPRRTIRVHPYGSRRHVPTANRFLPPYVLGRAGFASRLTCGPRCTSRARRGAG